MTIETNKEGCPPGGVELECPPPPKIPRNRPRLPKRSKLTTRKTKTGRQRKSNCNSSENLEGVSTPETDIMNNGRMPLNDLIVVPMPESCTILGIFESSGDKSPTPSTSCCTASQESTPNVEPSRKRGAKRPKKVKDGSKGDIVVSLPCRKSKRLLFRNNHKNIADKKLNADDSDSMSPYGRIVELIPSEMNRDDFLTKCLFLGSLDLAFTDTGAPQKSKTNNTDLKTETRSSSTKSTPKKIFNPLSLKTLCVLNIVKRKKQEYTQQELKHSHQIEKSGTGKDKDKGKHKNKNKGKDKDKDPDDDEDSWLNFGECMAKLKPPKPKVVKPVSLLKLNEYVEILYDCGTIMTFTGMSTTYKNELLARTRYGMGKEEGPWLNWGEYMAKILNIDTTPNKVVQSSQGMGAAVDVRQKKVSQRKQTVRA